jgi:small subunit ribosomal protein S20
MKRKATVLKKQRQEAKKRNYNRMQKSKIKTAVKEVKKSILNKDNKAEELLKKTNKNIDKSAAKRVIHKNTAARKKSRLAKFKNKFGVNTKKSDE